MTRLPMLLSCALTSVGIVMVAAGILAVPNNVLADAGSDCISANGCSGLTGTDLGNCVATCCENSTDNSCCSEACPSLDSDCINACLFNGLPNCSLGQPTCNTGTPKNGFECQFNGYCNKDNKCGCQWVFKPSGYTCVCLIGKPSGG